jgi:hypothetical protein
MTLRPDLLWGEDRRVRTGHTTRSASEVTSPPESHGAPAQSQPREGPRENAAYAHRTVAAWGLPPRRASRDLPPCSRDRGRSSRFPGGSNGLAVGGALVQLLTHMVSVYRRLSSRGGRMAIHSPVSRGAEDSRWMYRPSAPNAIRTERPSGVVPPQTPCTARRAAG